MRKVTVDIRTVAVAGVIILAIAAVAVRNAPGPAVVPEDQAGESRSKVRSAERAGGDDESSRNKAFQEQISALSTDQIQNRWDEIQRENLPDAERIARECQLIERLSRLGQFEQAKVLVNKYNDGMHRQALVFSLFCKSSGSLEEMTRQSRDPSFREADKALMWDAIGRNLSSPAGQAKLDEFLKSGNELSPWELGRLAAGVSQLIDPSVLNTQFYQDPSLRQTRGSAAEVEVGFALARENLMKLIDKAPEMKGELVKRFLGRSTGMAPYQAWNLFTESYDSLTPEDAKNIGSSLSLQMFAVSPKTALEAVGKLREKSDVSEIMGRGLKTWLERDSNSASGWLDSSFSSLGQKEADNLASTSFDHYLGTKDAGNARKWLERVSDPVLKSQAEDKLWSIEKGAFEKQMAADPAAALQSVISPGSPLPERRLEDAFGMWIDANPQDAEGWYKKNWEGLPASRRQYIAAAYASAAVKGGDPATARQWLGFIQDPSIVSRVEEKIGRMQPGSAE